MVLEASQAKEIEACASTSCRSKSNDKKDFTFSTEKVLYKAESDEKPDINSFSNMKEKFYYANKILALQRKIAEQVRQRRTWYGLKLGR